MWQDTHEHGDGAGGGHRRHSFLAGHGSPTGHHAQDMRIQEGREHHPGHGDSSDPAPDLLPPAPPLDWQKPWAEYDALPSAGHWNWREFWQGLWPLLAVVATLLASGYGLYQLNALTHDRSADVVVYGDTGGPDSSKAVVRHAIHWGGRH